jgi:putative SOS response-associated peptidase YedK
MSGRGKLKSLFWFAELWSDEDDYRYVICTREPHAALSCIHNRMPLILAQDEIEPWLAPETSREWIPNGVPEGSLRSYHVGGAIGTPGVETPDCIKPLEGALEQAQLW